MSSVIKYLLILCIVLTTDCSNNEGDVAFNTYFTSVVQQPYGYNVTGQLLITGAEGSY